VEFRILGPLEVRDNGRVLELGGAKQRAVLALLLLHANEVVALDRLIDGIWGERPPDTAPAAVHGSVSRLRKVLEPHGAPYRVIRTQAPGYVFAAGPETVDRYRFERLAAEGKTALDDGDAARSADLLREALALWRGPALADIAFSIADRTELDRLDEEWLSAVEERIDADLALGRHALLVPELEALVVRHPLRERLRGQLMVALYGAGRQADALETYRDASRLLDEELGIAPGPALRELERRILLQDPELGTPRPPAGASLRSTRARIAFVFAGAALCLLGVIAVVAMRDDEIRVVDRVRPNGIGAIDPASNTLVQSTPVGEYPEHLVVDDGSVWVANAGDHTVSQIESRTGQMTSTKGLTGAPVALNVSRGVVWIAMSHDGQPTSIMRLTGVPNESATHVVELAKGPGLLIPVLASGSSGLWASLLAEPDTFVLAPSGAIHRLDVLPDGCNPVGSGIAAATVWIGCADGRLVRVDEATRRLVATTRVGAVLSDLAVGAGAVWATDTVEDVVWRVDAGTGRATRTIPVGEGPSGIAIGFGSVWIASRTSGTVSRIDPDSNRVVATIRVGRDVAPIAVDAKRVWVARQGVVTPH
jgi:DNA-binding SARP family transcriptional activator/DNA-binding beta-propeller fold protein YncE